MQTPARLGTITITGVDPLASDLFPITYGVGFRATGAAGTVTVNGVVQASTGTNIGKFNRTPGLAG